jgi:hypothetical protein
MFVYITTIAFSNLYDKDNVEGLTQIYKNGISLFEFSIILRAISAHKVTKTHKNIFHDVF